MVSVVLLESSLSLFVILLVCSCPICNFFGTKKKETRGEREKERHTQSRRGGFALAKQKGRIWRQIGGVMAEKESTDQRAHTAKKSRHKEKWAGNLFFLPPSPFSVGAEVGRQIWGKKGGTEKTVGSGAGSRRRDNGRVAVTTHAIECTVPVPVSFSCLLALPKKENGYGLARE